MSTIPPALPLIKAGKLKSLSVTSDRRLPSMAEVPTITKSGIRGYEVYDFKLLY